MSEKETYWLENKVFSHHRNNTKCNNLNEWYLVYRGLSLSNSYLRSEEIIDLMDQTLKETSYD